MAVRCIVVLLVALFAVPNWLMAQVRSAMTHERDVAGRFGGGPIPSWSGTRLVGYELDITGGQRRLSKTGLVYAIDSEGRREDISIEMPGAETIAIEACQGGRDGAVVVAGYASASDARGDNFLMWISPDRSKRTVVQLQSYGPSVVAIASDGTIWAVGGIRTDSRAVAAATNNTLKRFDASGKELLAYQVKARYLTPFDATKGSHLLTSKDRVGWLTNAGEYIEFSLEGKEIFRVDAPTSAKPRSFAGVALDDEDNVYIGKKEPGSFQVLTLDRNSRAWEPILFPGTTAPRWGWVLGADKTTLVTFERSGVMRRHNRTAGGATGQ